MSNNSTPRTAPQQRPQDLHTPQAASTPISPDARAVVLSSKTVFQGKVFSVTSDEVVEPGGVTGVRDVVRHNGSIVILAVDPSTNPADPSILIERQYRHAAGQFLLELPAGSIDPDESPLAAARRELIEETGFRAGRSGRRSSSTSPAPASSRNPCRSISQRNWRPEPPHPKQTRKSSSCTSPLSDLLARIQRGEIHDGKTIIGVLCYATFHFASAKLRWPPLQTDPQREQSASMLPPPPGNSKPAHAITVDRTAAPAWKVGRTQSMH